MGTNDIALGRLAGIGPSRADRARIEEINRGIDATMREVIRGAKYNPNALDGGVGKVTPVGAVVAKVVGERWIEPAPLETPGGATSQRLIEGMVDAMQPHGAESPLREVRERRSPAAEAALAKAIAEARAMLKAAEPTAATAEPEPVEAEAEAAPEPVLVVAEPVPEPPAVVARAPVAGGGVLTRRKLT
jgi:hypothetical protein